MQDCESLKGSPLESAPAKTQETRAASDVSTAENIIARTRVPDTFACRVAQCPDLIEGTTRAGRPHRTCGAAGNKQPGKLERCPTGHLDRYYQAAEEKALGGRC